MKNSQAEVEISTSTTTVACVPAVKDSKEGLIDNSKGSSITSNPVKDSKEEQTQEILRVFATRKLLYFMQRFNIPIQALDDGDFLEFVKIIRVTNYDFVPSFSNVFSDMMSMLSQLNQWNPSVNNAPSNNPHPITVENISFSVCCYIKCHYFYIASHCYLIESLFHFVESSFERRVRILHFDFSHSK